MALHWLTHIRHRHRQSNLVFCLPPLSVSQSDTIMYTLVVVASGLRTLLRLLPRRRVSSCPPYLHLPVLRHLAPTLELFHRDRLFPVRRRTQRVACVRPEIECGAVRHDLQGRYTHRTAHRETCTWRQGARAKSVHRSHAAQHKVYQGTQTRTRLSQNAIELGSQWNRTWKSGFSLSWRKSIPRMVSDSALGMPTM